MRLTKDRFSENGPIWQSVDNHHDNNFKETISYFKNLGLIKNSIPFKVYKIKGLEINSSNVLIKSELRSFILKKYSQPDDDFINKQIELYKFLKEKKLPGPYILEEFQQAHEIKNGDKVLLLEYREGEYFKGQFKELAFAAKSISSFIKVFKNYDKSKLQHVDTLQENAIEILNNFLRENETWEKKIGIQNTLLLKKEWNKIYQAVVDSKFHINKVQEQDKLGLHIDLHPHNLLINNDLCTLLDIDSIKCSYWPTSLGFAIFKLLRQSLTELKADNEFKTQANNFVMTIGEEIFSKDIPWDILQMGAKIEILRRILIIIEGNLGEKTSKWNDVLSIQVRALKEINYIKNLLI